MEHTHKQEGENEQRYFQVDVGSPVSPVLPVDVHSPVVSPSRLVFLIGLNEPQHPPEQANTTHDDCHNSSEEKASSTGVSCISVTKIQ